MTVPHVGMDPQAILLRPPLEKTAIVTEGLQAMWHIIDAKRALTWCGLFLSGGSDRRLWSETPEERRCEACVGRFGSDVAL